MTQLALNDQKARDLLIFHAALLGMQKLPPLKAAYVGTLRRAEGSVICVSFL